MTPEELRACYLKHHRRLYLVALAVTLDRQMAEDAVHDALVRLLARNRRPNDPTAYVIRAVRNAAIDIARRRRREEPMQQEFLVSTDGPPCGISPRMLAEAFGKLGRAERETMQERREAAHEATLVFSVLRQEGELLIRETRYEHPVTPETTSE